MIELTEIGRKEVEAYIREFEAKRKEILDAGKDTVDEVGLLTIDDVLEDIGFLDEGEGEFYWRYLVTDNYFADFDLYLKRGIHYN